MLLKLGLDSLEPRGSDAGSRLDTEVGHLEVVNDEGESLRALAEADGREVLREAGLFEPLQRRVRDELELVAGLEDATPSRLDKDVVRSEDVDLVDTLGLEFGSARDAVESGSPCQHCADV